MFVKGLYPAISRVPNLIRFNLSGETDVLDIKEDAFALIAFPP